MCVCVCVGVYVCVYVCVCMCVCICVCVCGGGCAPVFAEALGVARSMNTSHLRIFCRYAAKFHDPTALQVLSGYYVSNRPVGIRIPAAV